MQAEEEAEQLVGGVDAEPDQGQEEAVAVVVAVRVTGAGSTATRLAAARGLGLPLLTPLSGAESDQQVVEFVPGHAGEAPESTGGADQRVVSKHLATSALPDRVGRS